jgi:hypothetical protein
MHIFRRLLLMTLCVVLLSAWRPTFARIQTADAQETLNALTTTLIPSANLITLAQQLRGVGAIPPYPTQPRKVYQVGDTETFWVSNQDTSKSFQVTAELLYITPHVYMWFQQGGRQPSLNAIKRSADQFETKIYPTTRRYFGPEESPGVDGDPHLYILHARGVGGSVAGYFGSGSSYPKAVSPYSNEAQLFVINLDSLGQAVGSADYEAVLAHEFQHMIHSAVDLNEDTWLNEGLSELSSLLNGYDSSGFAPLFMSRPTTQLNTWGENSGPHYGSSYLFVTYFLQRFGQNALAQLVADQENGLVSVEKTLRAINATDPITKRPISVLDFYADWQVTNLLNDPKVGDGRYTYTLIKDSIPRPRIPSTNQLKVGTFSRVVNPFGTDYLSLTEPGDYTIRFTGTPTVPVIPAKAANGSKFWWSNRADKSDSRLTRAFDLTGVKSATLQYKVWYAIEYGWDYGHLQVSTDNGVTWKSLATAHTTTHDPHRHAYGSGYSGVSGAAKPDDSRATAKWLDESVDLSEYAGKSILIRFQVVTDDAFNLPGMAIDELRIPELNYATDAESGDDGWKAEGWVRMVNELPQRYLVQAIVRGKNGVTVTRILDPQSADPINAVWTQSVGGDIDSVVLVISGVTDYTNEGAVYSLSITQ